MYMDYTYYIVWVLKRNTKMAKVVRKKIQQYYTNLNKEKKNVYNLFNNNNILM